MRDNGKTRVIIKGIELPRLETTETIEEKEINKYLGILETNMVYKIEMKERIKNKLFTELRKVIEIKLLIENLIKRKNTRGVSLRRYLALSSN